LLGKRKRRSGDELFLSKEKKSLVVPREWPKQSRGGKNSFTTRMKKTPNERKGFINYAIE